MAKWWRDAKVNGSIIPTRDYTPILSHRKLKAGTTVMIVNVRRGLFGTPTRFSVRNPKTGEYFREVPASVFRR